MYKNAFGTFLYKDIPDDVYYLGFNACIENDYAYFIASPEKTLCDMLYSFHSVNSIKDIEVLIYDNLRIDAQSIKNINLQDIIYIAPLYHSITLNTFIKYLNKEFIDE